MATPSFRTIPAEHDMEQDVMMRYCITPVRKAAVVVERQKAELGDSCGRSQIGRLVHWLELQGEWVNAGLWASATRRFSLIRSHFSPNDAIRSKSPMALSLRLWHLKPLVLKRTSWTGVPG